MHISWKQDCRSSYLREKSLVEVPARQQKVALEGRQVLQELRSHKHQVPKVRCNLQTALAVSHPLQLCTHRCFCPSLHELRSHQIPGAKGALQPTETHHALFTCTAKTRLRLAMCMPHNTCPYLCMESAIMNQAGICLGWHKHAMWRTFHYTASKEPLETGICVHVELMSRSSSNR